MVNGVKRFNLNSAARQRALLGQAMKEKNIIYGGQSLKAQMGAIARHSKDFDILSKKPAMSAKITERNFDTIHGKDDFFIKQARYKNTKKVMWKGGDGKKNTKDDIGVVDYTKQTKAIPFKKIRGVRYSTLASEAKTRKEILRERQFKYRHQKDADDLQRIKFWGRRL